MRGTSVLVPIALAAFVPVVIACFAWLGPRRGALASMLGGWLLLPVFDGRLDPPLFHSKAMLVPGVVLAASLLLDARAWLRLRPRLLDLPVLALAVVSFAASISNDLGPYDGASAAFEAAMTWGAPYLIGRLYLGEPGALGEFSVALAASALAYVPLCLWEIRMSPQLHLQLYGFTPWAWAGGNVVRFGGYRPVVFMGNSLMLAMFMACGTVAAYWLWRTRARRALWGVPMGWLTVLLVATVVLGKSTGAIILLAGGLAVLEGTRLFRTSALVLALLVVPPLYCTVRISGWTGLALVDTARDAINDERARSLRFRLTMENRIMAKAAEKPWLGWGRWGRYRVIDESGRDTTTPDGLWIITLGSSGLAGLLALGLMLEAPVAAMLRRFPGRFWGDPRLGPAAGLAVACLVWTVDEILNAMPAPLFPAIAGALVSFHVYATEAGSRRPRAVLRRTPGPGDGQPSPALGHGP